MRPAPIVPLELEPTRRGHYKSLAELGFSYAARNRADTRSSESIQFERVKAKPSARRRISASHPWYRMPRLPDAREVK